MAKLAGKVGGGLDASMAMTGRKDIKFADHFSRCDESDQREVCKRVMKHIRSVKGEKSQDFENLISLIDPKRAKKS